MKPDMQVYARTTKFFVFILIVLGSFHQTLLADADVIRKPAQGQKIHGLSSYLLSETHPLHSTLKYAFKDSHMFRSAEHFSRAGFKIKRGHKHLMVGFHPSIPQYLFKKFPDNQPQSVQLRNYITRIEGAKIVRKAIAEHHFKHLVVPNKWLYRLPSQFSSTNGSKSYVLIVENMNICDSDENLARYYNIDIEVLTELCIILHILGGCDAFPRNQPFTRDGKLAFIDTEHVGLMKGHFLKHVVPALNPELQAYAIALWEKLEDEEREKLLH